MYKFMKLFEGLIVDSGMYKLSFQQRKRAKVGKPNSNVYVLRDQLRATIFFGQLTGVVCPSV
jgi:hypothetical protein